MDETDPDRNTQVVIDVREVDITLPRPPGLELALNSLKHYRLNILVASNALQRPGVDVDPDCRERIHHHR